MGISKVPSATHTHTQNTHKHTHTHTHTCVCVCVCTYMHIMYIYRKVWVFRRYLPPRRCLLWPLLAGVCDTNTQRTQSIKTHPEDTVSYTVTHPEDTVCTQSRHRCPGACCGACCGVCRGACRGAKLNP